MGMTDREKVIKGLEGIYRCVSPVTYTCGDCPYQDNHVECKRRALSDALALLKEQEAKPPIHVHEEYPEHDWERKENGDIDDFACSGGYHNGPMCKRCHYSFCIFCKPNGWNDESCIIDEYKCPKCGRCIVEGTKFCSKCGQAVKWE